MGSVAFSEGGKVVEVILGKCGGEVGGNDVGVVEGRGEGHV
jgi:hypothetical protein